MCEVARNSVLQSGWEMQIKKRWLGENCHLSGPVGNDIHKSNVPNIRISYRYQTLMEERLMVLSSLRKMETPLDQEISVSDSGPEASAGSPKRMTLPAEPMLEHVLRSSPNYYAGSPKFGSFPNEGDVPPVTLQPALLEKQSIQSFPGVSILAERLGRDRFSSVLDRGYSEDHDDVWE